MPVIAAWFFGGFVVQLVTAIIELKEGNATGGNVMLFFAAFFMLASSLGTLGKFYLFVNGMSLAPATLMEGYFWLAAAAFLTICTPAYAKQNALMFYLVCVVDVILWCIAFVDIGILPSTFKPMMGTGLFVIGIVGIYICGAALVNTVYGKMLIPLPASILDKREAKK